MSIRVSQVLCTLCLLIAGVLLYAGIHRADGVSAGVISSMPQAGLLVLLAIGVLLSGIGWPRREGHSLHCTACGYQHRSGPIMPKCPECAANWRWYGGCTRGRLVIGKPFLLSGVPIMLLSGGALVVQLSDPGAFMRTVPTTILVSRLGSADPGDASKILEELNSRALSDQHANGVAQRLLNRRRADGSLSLEAHAWLQQRAETAGLTLTQESRYFGEMLELSMRPPTNARSGRWFDVETLSVYRGPRGLGRTDMAPWILLEGVEVVTPPSEVTVAPSIMTDMLRRAIRADVLDDRITGRRPERVSVHVHAPDADIVRVRLHGWIVFSAEAGIPDPLIRNDDGTLSLPPVALWKEPFELSVQIPLLAPLDVSMPDIQ